MAGYAYKKIRIKFDMENHVPAVAQFVGGQPAIYCGNDVMFEMAAYDGGVPADISLVTSIVMKVKPWPMITDDAVFTKTVATGFNPAMTDAGWLAGTDRHFAVAMTNAESLIALGTGVLKKDFYIVLRAFCTSTITDYTVGTAMLTVMEDGY